MISALALILFSSTSLASSVNYNLAGWPTGISSRVTLPPSWVPATNAPDYKGSLDVYWSMQIDTNNETLEVSAANAVAQGAPANFSLITLPDNCWGMNMNYGLIKLGQAADVTITVAADGSQMAPIFALYQGWDTGANSSRHDAIFFGENNPLGTTGLTYLGDAQNPEAKTEVSWTFTGLAAGKYELFTTVANNSNPGGAFKVTVATTPKNYQLTVKKPINGAIRSPQYGIDCGPASNKCQAAVPGGNTVTLNATADTGFSFLGWTIPVACAGLTDCTFTMTRDMTGQREIDAVFGIVPAGHAALTVGKEGHGQITSTPNGIDCGNSCTSTFTTYPIGTVVTLKAHTETGYSFDGWTGNCTGTGDCELTLSANKSVGAIFSPPGQCGSANNQAYTTAPTDPAELCAIGTADSTQSLKHGRFSWLCTSGTLAERCYTLGNNNKQNQAPLILSPGSQKVTVGQKKLIQQASGGSGNGAIQYKKSASSGTKCRLLPLGKKVRVFARGEPGVCKIIATKGRSRKYNEVQSAPITLTVTR
ncbi:MAG: hypothetical protein FJ247_14015 [Nitrospira sp.]|nr:hypothetical protein [Nitrospira sp.]